MLQERIKEIESTIGSLPDVDITDSFREKDMSITGSITVLIEELKTALNFDVIIYPQYPFKSHETETIKFSNKALLEYGHVMGDGSICIHTSHSSKLRQKLIYDVDSLKLWIREYYIGNKKDTHYEHIIVPKVLFDGFLYSYYFNEVTYAFKKDEYGYVNYSQISNGFSKNDKIISSIIQDFESEQGNQLVDVYWSSMLKLLPKSIGIFVFIEEAPVQNRRFAVTDWGGLRPFLKQNFFSFLHSAENKFKIKNKGQQLPLFVGYKISDTEIHWQAIALKIGQFPIYGLKENQKFITEIDDEAKINWVITQNCSYQYLFGRGKLEKSFSDGKVLILGIGAIGSIVAKTLVRCGCTKIDLIDFDVKEPENVCRSEYSFITGTNNKTSDLLNELYRISPYFESQTIGYEFSEAFDFYLKSYCQDEKQKRQIEEYLDKYDVIIDCSTDNDLLYVLSQLNLNKKLINLSISNHAKHLVCGVENNRYDFIMNQFNYVLDFNIEDLHNPTGCWSPTFKASYNDINVLVQYAIKHINNRYKENGKPLRNFVLETEVEDNFGIKLLEF